MLQTKMMFVARPMFSATSMRACNMGFHTKATRLQAPYFRSNFVTKSLKTIPKSKLANSLALQQLSRSLSTQGTVVSQVSQTDAWKRLGITAVAVGGTIFVANAFLNRDTRDALSPVEKSYLNESFTYTGGGLAITALVARTMFKNGFTYRVMRANPWVVLGVSLVGSIGTMLGVYNTHPDNTVQKHAFWLGFNALQAVTLSPLFFLNPAILSRAALYTAGVLGSLSYVGATASNDKYLYLGGPLLAGVTVVALSSLAPLALPLGVRSLAIAESISLYGGLAVFSGFVLFDTQKILQHARLAEAGAMPRDPMRESIALELDFINIFIRIVQILAMQGGSKRK